MPGITLEEIISAGYGLKATPVDDWRAYDEQNPVPGYFDFDWFSSRHPDLYHRFALTSDGLANKLNELVDFSGMNVLEVAAGTGRVAIITARQAKKVTAVDIFESVVWYGNEKVREAGLSNVDYLRGDCRHLPLPENAFDALITSWAILDFEEAYRVLKPGGLLLQLGPVPGALCGELTASLEHVYPHLILEVAPQEIYAPACPEEDCALQDSSWNGIRVIPPVLLHDFTYRSEYCSMEEAAAIVGRLYGPVAKRYIVDRRQSTLAWRLRIAIARVQKKKVF